MTFTCKYVRGTYTFTTAFKIKGNMVRNYKMFQNPIYGISPYTTSQLYSDGQYPYASHCIKNTNMQKSILLSTLAKTLLYDFIFRDVNCDVYLGE